MRYSLTLSYDGSQFHGWQIQPQQNSVQQTIEIALKTLLGFDAKITGAGRTDTSVNAICYVSHFDSPKELNCEWLNYKLNAILPNSIVVHSVQRVSPEFHSRFDAKSRKYTYYLHRVKDPFLSHYSFLYAYPDLDFDLMNTAAKFLLGCHDFSCFEKLGADNKTSICTITSAFWQSYTPNVCAWSTRNDDARTLYYWKFTISADRFLRNMVRAIVGTLLEVGRGKRSIEDFQSLILPCYDNMGLPRCARNDDKEPRNNENMTGLPRCARNDDKEPRNDIFRRSNPKIDCVALRSRAGESVPGHALFLDSVDY